MAEKWKLMEPSIRGLQQGMLEEAIENALCEDGDIQNICFVSERVDGIEGQTLDISGCRFERCTFGDMDFGRLSFVDCVFDKCELSNLRLSSAAFQRVQFLNCRMTGMELMRGALMSVLFSG